MTRSGRGPSDELMNMRVIYGAPEPPARVFVGGDCSACGNGAKLSGEKGCLVCGRFAGGEKLAEEIKAVAESMKHGAKVDAPPSYAGSDEIAAIQSLERLDDRARLRVLRYALSRWPVVSLDPPTIVRGSD